MIARIPPCSSAFCTTKKHPAQNFKDTTTNWHNKIVEAKPSYCLQREKRIQIQEEGGRSTARQPKASPKPWATDRYRWGVTVGGSRLFPHKEWCPSKTKKRMTTRAFEIPCRILAAIQESKVRSECFWHDVPNVCWIGDICVRWFLLWWWKVLKPWLWPF